jgi:hypothetical protein
LPPERPGLNSRRCRRPSRFATRQQLGGRLGRIRHGCDHGSRRAAVRARVTPRPPGVAMGDRCGDRCRIGRLVCRHRARRMDIRRQPLLHGVTHHRIRDVHQLGSLWPLDPRLQGDLLAPGARHAIRLPVGIDRPALASRRFGIPVLSNCRAAGWWPLASDARRWLPGAFGSADQLAAVVCRRPPDGPDDRVRSAVSVGVPALPRTPIRGLGSALCGVAPHRAAVL